MIYSLKHYLRSRFKRSYIWPVEALESEILNFELVRPYTGMTPQRAFGLIKAVKYLIENRIPGDFIECGVASGGASMLVALTLLELGVSDRNLYLYDLFGPMPHFMEHDFEIDSGKTVGEYYSAIEAGNSKLSKNWTFFSEAEVQKNFAMVPYPAEKIHFVKGDVMDTIPMSTHGSIALLRLDTDFYESTKVELEHLYPKLEEGGVLILDDYGHWNGAKLATDNYMASLKFKPFLAYVDSTARQAVKVTEN